MELNFSLINLKGMSVPAVKLVETVSGAIGAIYEPTAIRRRARAEADSRIIQTQADIETREMARRAAKRNEDQELRRQRSIEQITAKAASLLSETVAETPVDGDWTVRFFQGCQDVTDEQMQSIWAQILAGEVTRPGSFSPRTLTVVRDLLKEDARMFSALASYFWKFQDEYNAAFWLEIAAPSMNLERISTGSLLHLEALGLIQMATMEHFTVRDLSQGTESCFNVVSYFDRRFKFTLPLGHKDLDTGNILLTEVGRELAGLAGGIPNPEYCELALSIWRPNGVEIVPI